ncbi:hypothetical protein EDB81DRAFT_853077 [Dactylonectria macrodidyma]|uniref:Zn(2)-C6 fungal-type domain-containing protein n=1 Tax=Dactylonectria macrodidyma TaxID=307937 RepID=A0A9P9JKP2_9HYPO|nr:hypothetical protein EDB81DRAFT_853077 [Dactylonectria macrodidyma]
METNARNNVKVKPRLDPHENIGVPRYAKRPRTEVDDSDEGSSSKVRHRVTRACDECRRRKDRCDGQLPACGACLKGGRSCSYGPSKKRGLRTGYVRTLEVLLGLIFSTIENSEAWICGLLEGNVEPIDFRPSAPGTHISTGAAVDFLLEAWRKGSVAKQAEKLLTQHEAGDDEDEGTESTSYFDIRVSEALDSCAAQKGSMASVGCDPEAPLSPMNTDTTPAAEVPVDPGTTPTRIHPSFLSPDDGQLPPGGPTSFPSKPVASVGPGESLMPDLPSHWPYLLDVYFETTHCWFPIAQKHELLRIAYTLASSNTSTATTGSLSSGDSAFLHAALSYASHQSTSLPSSSKPSFINQHDTKSLHALTHGPLFADPATYDVGHVRAFLLLSLLEMDRELWTASWVAIGRAVYTAASVGLLPNRRAKRNESYDDGARRTLLGCVILESIISARLNVAPYFHASDVSSIGSLQINGIEEWEPWQPKILLGNDGASDQHRINLHTPGHIVSTLNRLLEVIAPLNEFLHQRRNFAADRNLHELIQSCQQHLSSLSDLQTTVRMPPQILSLWIASVAVFECVAAEWTISSGTDVNRPDGYWASFGWLSHIPEERVQVMGRCSVSPIAKACLVSLGQSLERQELQQVAIGGQSEIGPLRNIITRVLTVLHDPIDPMYATSGKEPCIDAMLDTSQCFVPNPASQFLNPIPPKHSNTHVPSASVVNLGTPLPSSNSDPQAKVPGPSSLSQDQTTNDATMTMLGLDRDIPFRPTENPSQEDIDDDGLFDSLATLDSTDWLANPPEFMQHLGVLGNPPSDIGNLFDMDY